MRPGSLVQVKSGGEGGVGVLGFGVWETLRNPEPLTPQRPLNPEASKRSEIPTFSFRV